MIYLFKKRNKWITCLLISRQLVQTVSSGPLGIFKHFSYPGFSFCSLCVSSYLHCEWATEQQLEKDKRIQQKIKRFKMKQAQRALLFADVRQFGCQWTFIIGRLREQLIILHEHVGVFMICCVWGSTCGPANTLIFFFKTLVLVFVCCLCGQAHLCAYIWIIFTYSVFNVVLLISLSRWWVGTSVHSLNVFWIHSSCHSYHLSDGRRAL